MTTLLAIVALVVLTLYVSWTANRLDRLHTRVDAAWAALDAQLLRRAAAVRVLAAQLGAERGQALERAARAALEAEPEAREERENALSWALAAQLTGFGAPGAEVPVPAPSAEPVDASGPAGRAEPVDASGPGGTAEPRLSPDLAELQTAATRVRLARSFHNAAVRDTRAVRLRRLPRALRLAGHRLLPQYFEIDDTRLAG